MSYGVYSRMKRLFLVSALLVGCGADSFSTASRPVGEDARSTVENDAGPVATGTGGVPAAGGKPSTGGTPAAAGGAPSTGGARETGGAAVVDAGAGGSTPSSGGAPAVDAAPTTGGAPETGGTPGTGGITNTGGVSNTGGQPDTGGAPATGGAGGCAAVTHDTGLGQTWQDCVPSGTYNSSQAAKACAAWCEAKQCAGCGTGSVCGEFVVLGTVSQVGPDITVAWSWLGSSSGAVLSVGSSACPATGTWD